MSIPWRVLECILLAAGFTFERQTGSHRSYIKPGVLRPAIIPAHREVCQDVILSNMRTAGISRDQYFKFLEDCK